MYQTDLDLGFRSILPPFPFQHSKVLEKGKPDDAMPGVKGSKSPLPPAPLSGMLNKHGGKVRLTFKMELDQLWEVHSGRGVLFPVEIRKSSAIPKLLDAFLKIATFESEMNRICNVQSPLFF